MAQTKEGPEKDEVPEKRLKLGFNFFTSLVGECTPKTDEEAYRDLSSKPGCLEI